LPAPGEAEGEKIHARSVTLSSDRLKLIAVIDLVEGSYHYKFTPGSMLTAHKNNAPVPSGLEGSVSTGHGLNVPVAFAPSGDSTILTSGVAAKKSRDCPPGHGDGHDCSVIK
jgi:hypothetical protein